MRRWSLNLLWLILLGAASAQGTSTAALPASPGVTRAEVPQPDTPQPSDPQDESAFDAEFSSSRALPEFQRVDWLIEPAVQGRTEMPRLTFDWNGASRQSFYFLSLQHGMRMVQRKTRRELGGKFFADYADSVRGLGGWSDGDSILTNYVGHPMQGGISGYIQIQNDPRGIGLEFSNTPAYWKSRLKAMGWAALYSTQFELGPVSEAAIGNVGRKHGTMGYVDLVMTPVGGFGLIVAEDAADRYWVRRLEDRTGSIGLRRFYRVVLNPQRSMANVFRGKVPWHRDTRSLRGDRPPPVRNEAKPPSPQPRPAATAAH